MRNKVCCIFNLAPHYRKSIYELMDKELECDFYFGDKVSTPIKLIDPLDLNKLRGFKKIIENRRILFNKFTWQIGAAKLVFTNYKYFIITGDPNILSNIFIALFAIIFRKKVYLWMHGLKGERLTWKGKLLIYPLYYLANKCLLYSDYSKEIMIKEGFSKKKIICIYNSLDYDKQLLIRNKLEKTNVYINHFKNNFPVLIYTGRIQTVKRLDEILNAMILLREEKIFCNLIIVGDDKENVCLDRIVAQNNLIDHVWFYGACYDEERIGELFYNAAVCVSPGNIGLTAMHSFSYGTPAITHNNFTTQMPEFEAINPGITGDFFEEYNVLDLSLKIKCWINLDTQKREQVRLATFKIIDERYNPHYQINVLKSLIN